MRLELNVRKDGVWDTELFKLPPNECYSVGLTNSTSNYRSTGMNNQYFVYSHVLAAFKKFIETIPHHGFNYFGYESKMDLVYNKMYQKYLVR